MNKKKWHNFFKVSFFCDYFSVFPSSLHDSVQCEAEDKLSDADENSPGKIKSQ